MKYLLVMIIFGAHLESVSSIKTLSTYESRNECLIDVKYLRDQAPYYSLSTFVCSISENKDRVQLAKEGQNGVNSN